jgi:hypothetical protein
VIRARRWYRERQELRKAEERIRAHLEAKRVVPDHDYPMREQDLATIRNYGRSR